MQARHVQPQPNWKSIRAWYRASRPFTLSAALTPVLVGSSLAFREGKADIRVFVLVLVASALVQVTANLVDEYSDHERPEAQNKLPAPHKVIALGVLSSRAVKTGAVICASVAGIIGLFLVSITGWQLLVVCLLSLTTAYFYSAGPRPLGSIGLGHPLVFVFMGPVMVIGTYYVQAHVFASEALWLSIAVGCSVTIILLANDLRDLEEDRGVGKVTPVTAFGRAFGRWEWIILAVIAFVVVGWVAAAYESPLVLIGMLAIPQTVKALSGVVRARERTDWAQVLKASSKLHGQLGLMLSVGIGLGRFVSL